MPGSGWFDLGWAPRGGKKLGAGAFRGPGWEENPKQNKIGRESLWNRGRVQVKPSLESMWLGRVGTPGGQKENRPGASEPDERKRFSVIRGGKRTKPTTKGGGEPEGIVEKRAFGEATPEVCSRRGVANFYFVCGKGAPKGRWVLQKGITRPSRERDTYRPE